LVPQALFNAHPVFIESAQGARLRDVEGKEYIDLTSGIGVNNLGHGHPVLVDAIAQQSQRFLHTCFKVGMHSSYLDLADKLHQLTPGKFSKQTFFATSGAEAVEGAVKFARAFTSREAVITFHYAFHGRTFYALQLTGRARPYRVGFGRLYGDVHRIPFPNAYRCSSDDPETCVQLCLDALEELFIVSVPAEAVAAIVFEPVLGEGGIVVPPPGFFPRISSICRKKGILMIADEIQTGIGRTGTFCASEQFDVIPDLIAFAKSLGFGLPISAVTGRADVMQALELGGLGGTMGGNPLACATALAGLDILERDNLMLRARDLGKRALDRLGRLKHECALVGDVRGLGLMIGIELVKDRRSKQPANEEMKAIAEACRNEGVLLLYGGPLQNILRLLPPLTIAEDEFNAALDVLEITVRRIAGG
jgi:4-aminobutyrate aminotransferase/(S)-3-amino-2-methylpropionate transaminase